MTDIRATLNFKIIKWVLFVVCLIYILLMILFMFMSGRIADYDYDEYAKEEQQSNINSRGSSISGTKNESPDDVDPEAFKNNVKIFIIIIAIISIMVYSFGLIGAYKEHLCLTVTFAILMSIGTLFIIVLFLITFENKTKIVRISIAIISLMVYSFGVIGAYKGNKCLTLTFAILVSIGTLLGIVAFLITFNDIYTAIVNIAITILAFAFARDLHSSRAEMSSHPIWTHQTAQPMLQTVIPLYPSTVIGQPYPQHQQQQYNAGMVVYGGRPMLQQQPPNYSDVPPYMPSGLN